MSSKERQKYINKYFIKQDLQTPFGVLTIYKHKGLI